MLLATLVLSITLTSKPVLANRLEAGFLKCEVDGGIGFVFGSTKNLVCVFHKSDGRTEAYNGEINKFGIDLGATAGGVMAWTVLANTRALPPAELAGSYVGANADASLGVGGGADLLVGASNKTVTLQPLSLKGQVGLNLAVGVAELDLRPVFREASVWKPSPSDDVVAVDLQPERVFADQPHYGCGSYFILRQGDTLSKISRSCGVTVEALLEVNPDLKNVRELPVGLAVKIPSYTGHPGAYPCDNKVILKPGEHLDQMAWHCGVTMHALLQANSQLTRASQVKAGLVLNIPKT